MSADLIDRCGHRADLRDTLVDGLGIVVGITLSLTRGAVGDTFVAHFIATLAYGCTAISLTCIRKRTDDSHSTTPEDARQEEQTQV